MSRASTAAEPIVSAPPGDGGGAVRRLIDHLRTPLHRNAYALVASGMITSALGLAYWMFAAHHYTDADIGLGSAAISMMVLIANLAGLGLQNGFIRLIPTSGRRTSSFVFRSMTLAAVTAALLAVVFLLGVPWWAPRLEDVLRSSPIASLAFVVGCVVWVVFVLQDTALIGLRRSTVIPVENFGFSLLKIILVIALAATLPTWGVFASWGLSAGLAVLAVSGIVLPRILSSTSHLVRGDGLPERRGLFRYLAAEHASLMVWMATVELVPLIVLHRLGAATNAYFYLSAQLATSLSLLPSAIGLSFTAEAATHPAALQALVRKGARNIAIILVPVVALVVVFAPYILELFGDEYRENATTLLRLRALSVLPYAATALIVSVARVQGRMRVVTLTYVALATSTFLLTIALIGPYGLDGAGVASLVAQSVVAVVALVTQLHRIGVRGPERFVVAVVRAPARAVERRSARRVVRQVLPAIEGIGIVHSVDVLTTQNDVIVARVRSSIHGTQILKVSTSPGAAVSVRRAAAAMHAVRAAAPQVASWVPSPTSVQAVGSRMCSLEEFRSGDTGLERLEHRSLSLRSISSGLDAVGRLHEATSTTAVIDGDWLRVNVAEPIDRVRRVITTTRSFEQLDAVRERLELELSGRRVQLSTIHGDLAPGNLLFDLETRELAALIDWEASVDGQLPEIDLFQFLLALHSSADGEELDESIPRLINPSIWSMRDRAIATQAGASRPNLDNLGVWPVLALSWLAHVDANLGKARWYAESGRWLDRNVVNALSALTAPTSAGFGRALLDPAVPVSSAVVPASSVTPASSHPAPISAAIDPAMLPWRTGPLDVVPASVPVVESVNTGSVARALASPAVIAPAAVLLWVLGVAGIDLRAMSDIGLLSVIRPAAYAGLGLLLVGIAMNLRLRVPNGRRLGALLTTFIVLVHGTPAALYAALRYSWAWKHVGIVDFIVRTGGVDSSVGQLAVYHQWPGFFSGSATLVRLVGADNALAIASWAPVAFNLMNLALLLLVLSSLANDRRVVWLAATLFFVTNWVGQDYFSPQALTYVMHLGALGVVLQRFRRGPVDVPGRSWNALPAGIVVCALIITVAMSHQLTPVVLTGSLAALALFRQTRTWRFVAVSVVANVIWATTVARPFVSSELSSIVDRFGDVADNAGGTLSDTAVQSSGQALVSTMGRLSLVLIGVLAVVGFVRRWRAGRREWIPALLIAVPGSILVANDYGGEVVFRVVLFAMPFLALLAAWAVVPQAGRPWAPVRTLAVVAVTGMLLTGFLFGYYGKERQYSFSSDEARATQFVELNSEPGTLLVTLNSNYPNLVEGYERFTTVPIVNEPLESRNRVLADPATVLAGWLSNPAYTDSWILLTRSQVIAANDLGDLPATDSTRLIDQLRDSGRFVSVFDADDAVVFRLADPAPDPDTSPPAPTVASPSEESA